MSNFEKLLSLFKKSPPKKLFINTWDSDMAITTWSYISDLTLTSGEKKKEDERILKKPVEVFNEIISETPSIDLTNLDGKIEMIKERMNALKKHIKGNSFAQEENALIYLNARKKYFKNKDLFKWPTTDNILIDKLCKKYKVKSVSIDNYYRNVPKEGVDEIVKYGKAFKKVSNADFEFKLIVDDAGKEQTKDPILLAQSPFGNWYYVLGAWDKEVEILDDIIYKGK